MNKFKYISLSVVIFIGLLLFSFQYYFFGIDANSIESYLINLVSSIIVLIGTVFILEDIFKRYHEKINSEKELEVYKEVLLEAHNQLSYQLKAFTIIFITKSGHKGDFGRTRPDDESITLEHLLDNINDCIDENFISKKITFRYTSKDPLEPFSYDYEKLSYTEYLNSEKAKTLSEVNEYISLYSRLIPKHILKTLIKIQKTLSTNVMFKTLEENYARKPRESEQLSPGGIEFYTDNLKHLMENIIEFQDSVKRS